MKTARIVILFFALLSFVACDSNDEVIDKTEQIILYVSAETGTYQNVPDNNYVEGMRIKEKGEFQWICVSFQEISGFTFENGYEYELLVNKIIVANPPADSGNVRYQLIEVLKKEKDPSYIPDPNPDSTINSEEDIEYQDLCPINKYGIGRDDKFIVDRNGEITYSNGSSLPSYDKYATIYIENILDKEDPNWAKFQEVAYMARYTYVLSPFTDEIRLLPINHSDLLFNDVIPQNEFDSIRDNLTSGEELHYALILANVHKKAIQKLAFTIQKK